MKWVLKNQNANVKERSHKSGEVHTSSTNIYIFSDLEVTFHLRD